jgi:hypothetical protein
MSSSKLVRHPAPYPTESLPGYVLRISELNGYPSPRSLYRLAGLNADEVSPSRFNCAKFATIVDQEVSRLELIALKSAEDDTNHLQVLGNRVSSGDLDLTGARVCPDCVRDSGYIEAHWHIDLMVACPVHRQAAIYFCGRCRSRLAWIRSGLLTCKCGAPLLTPPRDSFSDADFWLFDLIRQKALVSQTCHLTEQSMPGSQLAQMNLQSLLSLVRFLGKQRLTVSRSRLPKLGRHIVQAASGVLEDWPLNFHKLLKVISPNSLSGKHLTDSLEFEDVQRAISERWTSRLQGRAESPSKPSMNGSAACE